jgi:hypothetical protein
MDRCRLDITSAAVGQDFGTPLSFPVAGTTAALDVGAAAGRVVADPVVGAVPGTDGFADAGPDVAAAEVAPAADVVAAGDVVAVAAASAVVGVAVAWELEDPPQAVSAKAQHTSRAAGAGILAVVVMQVSQPHARNSGITPPTRLRMRIPGAVG